MRAYIGGPLRDAVSPVTKVQYHAVRLPAKMRQPREDAAMTALKIGLAALAALPLIAYAQGQTKLGEGQSSSSCLDHIVFSQQFLRRYPRAGAACREVKVEKGQKWARFDADVVRVTGNRVVASFIDRYGHRVSSITFDASRDARVYVNNRSTAFSALRPGDKLSFWIPEDRVGFYARPGALQNTKLAVVDTSHARR
jgi:hypothetical protein